MASASRIQPDKTFHAVTRRMSGPPVWGGDDQQSLRHYASGIREAGNPQRGKTITSWARISRKISPCGNVDSSGAERHFERRARPPAVSRSASVGRARAQIFDGFKQIDNTLLWLKLPRNNFQRPAPHSGTAPYAAWLQARHREHQKSAHRAGVLHRFSGEDGDETASAGQFSCAVSHLLSRCRSGSQPIAVGIRFLTRK
jgi:hypothetical protein